jgi:hypothetical protein
LRFVLGADAFWDNPFARWLAATVQVRAIW